MSGSTTAHSSSFSTEVAWVGATVRPPRSSAYSPRSRAAAAARAAPTASSGRVTTAPRPDLCERPRAAQVDRPVAPLLAQDGEALDELNRARTGTRSAAHRKVWVTDPARARQEACGRSRAATHGGECRLSQPQADKFDTRRVAQPAGCVRRYARRVSPGEHLRRAYAAFNARDIDTALALMHPEVDWPNAIDGGRVFGRDAIRAYWAGQFETTDPRVEPLRIAARGDGRYAVDVHQIVHDLDGAVLAEGDVVHVYELRDGLVARMDIEEPGSPGRRASSPA